MRMLWSVNPCCFFKSLPGLMIWLCLLLCAFPACTGKKPSLPASSGKTLEVLVVVDRKEKGKALPVSVPEVFHSTQAALNQPEPRFDLLVIPSGEFTALFNPHHNILQLKIYPDLYKEGIVIRHDLWSVPQVVVEISARSDSGADRLIRSNAAALQQVFYENESRKISGLFRDKTDKNLAASLLQQQGIVLNLPACFYIAASGKNYFWLRCRDGEQESGLVTAKLPYTDTALFEPTVMIRLCDSLVTALIPGSRPGSHMTIYEGYPPLIRQSDIQGQFAMELRGLWETRNDQMGGPFVAFFMTYPSRKHLLIQYAYVYHPNEPKRDLLMQMEAIMRTLTFPAQAGGHPAKPRQGERP